MSNMRASKTLSMSVFTWKMLWELCDEHNMGVPEMVGFCVKKVYDSWKAEKGKA